MLPVAALPGALSFDRTAHPDGNEPCVLPALLPDDLAALEQD